MRKVETIKQPHPLLRCNSISKVALSSMPLPKNFSAVSGQDYPGANGGPGNGIEGRRQSLDFKGMKKVMANRCELV